MHICVLSATAFLRAASMALAACSRLTCMVLPSGFGLRGSRL
jgi:hypothetical protein